MIKFMVYLDYKSAAEKHLETCNKLLRLHEQEPQNQKIILNIYYLSGYVFEGIINYLIFHLVLFSNELLYGFETKQKRQFWQKNWDVTEAKNYPIIINSNNEQNIQLFFNSNATKKDYPIYCLDKHNFYRNRKLLEHITFPPCLQEMPLILKNSNNDNVNNLFKNWNSSIRYKNNYSNYNLTSIRELINFADIMFGQIRKI